MLFRLRWINRILEGFLHNFSAKKVFDKKFSQHYNINLSIRQKQS
jgi:hypothetical protein